MNKLVIFDLDGTLLNSVSDIADNINIMLKKFGYPERSTAEIMQFIGHGARNLVKNSIGIDISEQDLDERLSYYNEIYTNCGSPKTSLYNGIDELLTHLKERDYKLAILTNKPQMTTDEVYKEYLSQYNFDMVVGQRAGKKIKPDPETVNEIIDNLKADRENTYFVGDGEPDVQVAINAKVSGISALWGFRNRAQLEKAGAKIFALTPIDVIKFIK